MRSLLALAALLLTAPPLFADGTFPPLSPEALTLEEVHGHPDVPAVVLLRRAELTFGSTSSRSPSSLEVWVRTKILTEAGMSLGQVSVAHGGGRTLEVFEGRTVLPDGSIVPLGEQAIFGERLPGEGGRRLAKTAFPAVAVGTIVDLHFRLSWPSLGPETFVLDGPLPTLRAEFLLRSPEGLEIQHHLRGPESGRISESRGPEGVFELVAEALPPVVEEPYSLPLEDLQTRITAVPAFEIAPGGRRIELFDRWATIARRVERAYAELRHDAHTLAPIAQEIFRETADDTIGEVDRRIAALFQAVRDRVETVGGGIGADPSISLAEVLEGGEGRPAEKALLLQALLQHLGVPSNLVWAVDWRRGYPDLEIVDPGRPDSVMLVADIRGERTFLDPSDPRLAPGRLSPVFEGTQALELAPRGPRVIELPQSPAEANQRSARLELALDPEGFFAGTGGLIFTGHHAWFYFDRLETAEARREAWLRWLEDRLPGYEISEVEAVESIDAGRLELSWAMRQWPDEVLGDEASLSLSRPLGPIEQRYTQPPGERQTAVHTSFLDRDEVELHLTWPEGWEVELVPDNVSIETDLLDARAEVRVDRENRHLFYRRELEIREQFFPPSAGYADLRELYAAMERHDAQALFLLRP